MHNSAKPSSSSSSPSSQSLEDESDQDITRFDKSLQVHFHLLLSHAYMFCGLLAVSLLTEFVTTACRDFDTYVLSFIMLPIIPKPLS
jgi:hypothetical protein